MEIAAVICLIALGVLLIILELLVFPGHVWTGVAGLLFMATGIFFSYNLFGIKAGNYILGGSIAFLLITLIYALRAKTWNKLMLKSEIDSNVAMFEANKIKTGDRGITISRLAPMGKVFINDIYVEGQSMNELINENTEVEVVKVLQNKIIVKIL
ncbi:MAG: NfeD family protein [Bacteroidia bacterium]|nr:NfeD family protein [Bacteroidia bacterium]